MEFSPSAANQPVSAEPIKGGGLTLFLITEDTNPAFILCHHQHSGSGEVSWRVAWSARWGATPVLRPQAAIPAIRVLTAVPARTRGLVVDRKSAAITNPSPEPDRSTKLRLPTPGRTDPRVNIPTEGQKALQ